jgi:hypothetical protein
VLARISRSGGIGARRYQIANAPHRPVHTRISPATAIPNHLKNAPGHHALPTLWPNRGHTLDRGTLLRRLRRHGLCIVSRAPSGAGRLPLQ